MLSLPALSRGRPTDWGTRKKESAGANSFFLLCVWLPARNPARIVESGRARAQSTWSLPDSSRRLQSSVSSRTRLHPMSKSPPKGCVSAAMSICRFGDSLLLLPNLVQGGRHCSDRWAERFPRVETCFPTPAQRTNPELSSCTISGSALPRGALSIVNPAADVELDTYLHLSLLNRGIMMTPFHNMALMCPTTTAADVDRHTAAFDEVVATLRR